MPNRFPTVKLQSLYIRQIADHVGAVGADVPSWLAQAGLRPAQLQAELPELPLDVFARLVEGAIATTREPALGLLIGDRLRINTHGLLGFAAMSGGSLRQVIDLVARYIGLRTSLVTLTVQEHPGELRLVVLEPVALGSIRRTVLEAVLLAIKHALEFSAPGGGPVSRIAFALPPPAYADFARQLVRCELAWSSHWSGLTVPLDRADDLFDASDAAAFHQAEKLCERELARLSTTLSTTARVQRLLLESTTGWPALPLVARQLHLGERTLHRRLLEEGTSFRQVTEDLRSKLASEHLQAGALTVQEVAFALGYTDLANFRRAFKRWHGISPSEYRAERGHG